MEYCDCINWVRLPENDNGRHHNGTCEKYATEKFDYLFFLDEGIDAWSPELRGELAAYVENFDEPTEVQLKIVSMTDKEFNAIPEA